ncbi:MAG TPA: glycohydrolase toxin TNT-related protein, partial [Pseudonocardiaceae bacterium]
DTRPGTAPTGGPGSAPGGTGRPSDSPATAGRPGSSARPDPAGQQGSGQPGSGQPAQSRAGATPGQSTGQPSTSRATADSGKGEVDKSQQNWQIQPLPGEPPLTLYRDKRMVLLPPGTEIDRYGEANGNVAYAARTNYPQRSLPSDWSSLPYHIYRLQRPLEALTGLAVPWFEQPGGGTAFVLPRAISDLVAEGALVEIN